MLEAEAKALEWVGRRSQRVMALSGAPFIVVGVLGLIPSYFALRELSFVLLGVNSPKLTALLACLPTAALVRVGLGLSKKIRKWWLPRLVREAAERHGVDEGPLRDMFL